MCLAEIGSILVAYVSKENIRKSINEVLVKFVAPVEPKGALQDLANERSISLSALVRLVVWEYVKRKMVA